MSRSENKMDNKEYAQQREHGKNWAEKAYIPKGRLEALSNEERASRKEAGDRLVQEAEKYPWNRNCYVGAIAYNYELAGDARAKQYRYEWNERCAGRWNSRYLKGGQNGR